MNLIILTEEDRTSENIFRIADNRAIHIQNILKSEAGDLIEVGLLNGPCGNARVVEITADYVDLEIRKLTELNHVNPQMDIICALPRPQTLKKVLSICGTMGVRNLYLIRSEKVEKSYFHSPLLQEKNYSKFLIEGLSQGKRTAIPKVSIHNKFKVFFNETFENLKSNEICLLAHPDTGNYLNTESFEKNSNIILAIGPEGGWNEFETNLMVEKGFTKFRLSESILRVENAVTAALSQIELLNNNS